MKKELPILVGFLLFGVVLYMGIGSIAWLMRHVLQGVMIGGGMYGAFCLARLLWKPRG
ncbi:hypothetical protein KIKIMORA_01990 [Brevundimonas phage vB_BpoS-Kikimora]|uniref:Uncharacterized protein n=2 Tax=Kikimoravirus TaxID=3425051 RepID=A0A9E7SS02_9CAUD|nr:hypothetical protein KIKIMORA_01990 [Brevundimonas phage vB_BpoS-Kikimora]UTC28236.1 hypothetical protein GURKE_02050 [Brevundimonas phage vB_BpoS-Gurke]